MNNYICKYGLYHDKPVIDGEPSSNNGWIYSAYAHALDLPVASLPVNECNPNGKFTRLPGLETPPFSRDEMIGMAYLCFDVIRRMDNWYFYGEKPKFSLWTQLKAAWKIRNEHRNYFWKNEVLEVYPLAFTIWHHDRYYIKKIDRRKTTLLEWLAFHAYMLWELSVGEPARLNLLWVQLEDLGSKFWIKFIDHKSNFKKVFPADHPFNN